MRQDWRDLSDESQELPKLVDGQSGVAGDPAHRYRIDGIVAREHDFTRSIRHDDVLTLSENPETDLLQCADRIEMINPWQLRHG
jgi:hypothetical protein